jgi:vitamin B12 transporter
VRESAFPTTAGPRRRPAGRRPSRRHIASITLTIALGARASSPAEELPATNVLAPVVVTATRTPTSLEDTPQTITVLTRDELEAREDPSVADVLREVPGVNVTQSGSRGTTTSVTIRGSQTNQVLTLLDGVEVNSGTLGAFDFANVSPEGFDRIEVLRGSGGSLYGSEAIGGVINLITRSGTSPGLARTSLAGGNGATDREAGEFAGRSGDFALAGAVTHLSTAGFRPPAPVDASGSIKQNNDDYETTFVSARGDYLPTPTGSLHAIVHYLRSEVGLVNASNFINVSTTPGEFQSALDPNARQRDDFYFAKLEWEDAPSEGLSYRLAGAYVRDDQRFRNEPDPANMDLTLSSIPNELFQGDAQVNYSFRKWSVTTVGFEYKRKDADVDTFDSFSVVPGVSDGRTSFRPGRENYSVYVQQQLRLLDDALIVIGGFRHDQNQQFGSITTPAADIGYRVWQTGTRFRATYGEGFRAPTFNDLFFPNFGFPGLKPERSAEWNVGIDQDLLGGRVRLSVTYFNRDVKDQIEATVVDPVNFKFEARNVGRVKAEGVEVEPSIDVGHGVRFGGAYTYLSTQSHGGSATVLRQPFNQMSAFVQYDTPALFAADDALQVRTSVFYVGDRQDADPVNPSNTNNPQYTRVDLAGSYRFPWRVKDVAFSAFANVANLFDRRYDEVLGFRARPLNFLAGLRATF